MWLLNVTTLELEEFIGSNIPLYGILSHTWGLEEVTFSLMKKAKYRPEAEGKAAYFEIRGCCKQARKDGLKYAWIDSCCNRNVAQVTIPCENGGSCIHYTAEPIKICFKAAKAVVRKTTS
jgi:hypothetical protein